MWWGHSARACRCDRGLGMLRPYGTSQAAEITDVESLIMAY